MSLAATLRSQIVSSLGPCARPANGLRGPVKLRRLTPGTYDPTTGESGADATQDFTGTGWLTRYADRLVDGKRFTAKDRRLTFVPQDITYVPAPDDLALVGSDTYSVIEFATSEVGGELVAYTIQVRTI